MRSSIPPAVHRLLPVLFLSFTLGAQAQRKPDDQDPVPTDLGKEPTVILGVRTDQKKMNTALEEPFTKYYKGTFKLVDQLDIDKGAYDVPGHRYCFRTVTQYHPASGSGDARMPATYDPPSTCSTAPPANRKASTSSMEATRR